MSENRFGLQNCLKKLQTYCDEWKLKVNTKKPKTMKVEKRRSHKSEEIFLLGETAFIKQKNTSLTHT